MGIDLRLLPLDMDRMDIRYSHTILQVNTSRDLWDRIAEIKPRPLAENVSAYIGGTVPDGEHEGGTCYGLLSTDPYGNRYTWVTAGELVTAFVEETLARAARYPHMALTALGPPWTLAYLRALPPETRVVLAWH